MTDASGGGEGAARDGPRDGTHRPGRLGSRILVTWIELLVVGLGGMALGTAAGGPVALVAYFLTTLASVGVLLYNVAALVDRKLAAARAESMPTNDSVGDRRA